MNSLRLLLASIGVVLFQWAFLQGLPLSQYGNPYIYIWVLMLLPQPMSRQRQFLTAFLLGSIMDGKNDMPGYSNVLTYEEAQNVLEYIRETLKRRPNR